MALTRLKNIITSRTGRIIYVNPDDFDASDSFDNRGNSALRPFKTLQRAFLEVSRFSYRVGLSNDEFDAFSIYLYPSEYVLDNRPGLSDFNQIQPFNENTNFDITSASNEPYKFNSTRGGIIVLPEVVPSWDPTSEEPRLCPKYVPYPTVRIPIGITAANEADPTAIFRLTGATYFWQMSFFDGDNNGVFYRDDLSQIAPNFSHHKLTCFEYANTTDLNLYYQKISKAYATIPDSSGIMFQDQLQARVEENKIVISDEFAVSQIIRNGQTATAFTVDELGNSQNHGFSVGVAVNISGVTESTEQDQLLYNGSFFVTSAQGNQFTYQMSKQAHLVMLLVVIY